MTFSKDDLETIIEEELKERVECYDEELFEELVDNVTQQYAKLPNTFGGQS